MLFNTQLFLLLFLPATLCGYYLLRDSRRLRVLLLVAASMLFYGYWDYRFMPLLACSILFNWIISELYLRYGKPVIIHLGVAINLLSIGVFKYFNFFSGAIATILGVQQAPYDIILPLGISFFTFQQISYLLDLRGERRRRYSLPDYALYVSFFPQLIAGPIIRHDEIAGQFELAPHRHGLYLRLAQGSALLLIGLGKKILLADKLALLATPLFTKAAAVPLGPAEGWTAALAYTFQLYFDFSGYSDMAIGLGLLFGFTIPINFNAPYVATSIREFWRRWHITLSRFLQEYLYIPLGGNRFGLPRQIAALGLTMLLGGLWHGAGWTFVAWGGLHGLALSVNHLWRRSNLAFPRALGWAATMLFVVLCWVIFRAETFGVAANVLAGIATLPTLDLSALPGPDTALLLGIAAALATLGPTSHRLVYEKLVPWPPLAFAAGLFLVFAIMEIGSHGYTEFIYFQF